MRGTLMAALLLGLAACGGGGDSQTSPPVASTATFPVRSALDAMLATPGINVNVSGRDNAIFPIKQPDDRRPNDWFGQFSISKRAATAANTPAGCAGAVTLVDARIVLTRYRDGYRMQEGATFGYAADYKPLCAFLLDGHYWFWNASQPLPATAVTSGSLTGVESGGTVQGAPFSNATITSLVALDADTANSAWLSFVYHATPSGGSLPFQMFGETTEFRFRLDTSGAFIGFQYLRTGTVPDPTFGNQLVTLQMSSF